MKIISAIGSYKGSLDSVQLNQIVKDTLEKRGHVVETVAVADGGDGLLTALCYALGGREIEVDTVNALGEPIKAKVGIAGKIGIIEMALASGLALLGDRLNPLKASTFGTGVLIKTLADMGVTQIIIGLGGSATNDGGTGCLNALGFEFLDKDGNAVIPNGENLKNVDVIKSDNLPSNIANLDVRIACDVTNPLCGKEGATYVYGRQKGADDNTLAILESGMKNYAQAVARFVGKDKSCDKGAGAAGGLGFGLIALLGARIQNGARLVLQLAGYKEKLNGADVVITGEGRLDNQTAFGKLPQIVAEEAYNAGVKCVALCGSCIADQASLDAMHVTKAIQLISYAPLEKCLGDTENVVKLAALDTITD